MPKVNMTNRKSFIWLHYRALDDSNARCNVCHKRLSYKTSISNLKKHMVKKHPLVNLSESTHYAATAFPDSPGQEDENGNDDEDSYDDDDDDPDDVKTLLELSGAHVKKTVEIIEEITNGNHVKYHRYENNDDNDDLVVKRVAKPALRKCLQSIEAKIKKEPSPTIEVPILKPEDSIDVLIKNIGNKLRKMPEKQQIIAEYKIHEVLFLGLSNQLKCPIEEGNHHLNYSMPDMNSGVSDVV